MKRLWNWLRDRIRPTDRDVLTMLGLDKALREEEDKRDRRRDD